MSEVTPVDATYTVLPREEVSYKDVTYTVTQPVTQPVTQEIQEIEESESLTKKESDDDKEESIDDLINSI